MWFLDLHPIQMDLLSFGHARGLTINGEYSKLYDGKLILRFDDTDTVVKAND